MKEFKSFGGFSKHLVTLSALHNQIENHLVKESAELIAKEAKSRIGHRQEGWKDLAESTKLEKQRLGYAFNSDFNPGLRTGELYASYGSSSEGNKAIAGSTSEIALLFENGTTKMPPREIMRPSAIEKQKEIEVMIGNTVISWVSGLGYKRPKKRVTKNV